MFLIFRNQKIIYSVLSLLLNLVYYSIYCIRLIDCLPFFSDVLPPDNAPRGKAPVGVRPFNCNTLSLSSLQDQDKLQRLANRIEREKKEEGEKTRAKKKMFLFDSALINPERAGIPIPLQTIYPRKTFDIFSTLRKFDPQNRRTDDFSPTRVIFHFRFSPAEFLRQKCY